MNKNDRKPHLNIEAVFSAPDGSLINLSVTINSESDSDDAIHGVAKLAIDPITWVNVMRTFRHAVHNADPDKQTMFEMDEQGNHHKIPSTEQ